MINVYKTLLPLVTYKATRTLPAGSYVVQDSSTIAIDNFYTFDNNELITIKVPDYLDLNIVCRISLTNKLYMLALK